MRKLKTGAFLPMLEAIRAEEELKHGIGDDYDYLCRG